jgi:hypothetical protein
MGALRAGASEGALAPRFDKANAGRINNTRAKEKILRNIIPPRISRIPLLSVL